MKRLMPFIFLLLVSICLVSCNKEEKMDELEPDNPLVTEVSMVDRFNGQKKGTTILTRSEDQISVKVETSDLKPGHVYKLVVATVDIPEECRSTPCTAADWNSTDFLIRSVFFTVDAFVATSNFYELEAVIKEKDVTTYDLILAEQHPNDFGGLQDAIKAEVHIYLRSQGPEIPGQLEEQMNDFLGGCTTNWMMLDTDGRIPSNEGECAWTQKAIHMPKQ
jgi:hypothetical protein